MLKTFSRAVILALSSSLLTAAVAVAAAYPERPITVVVAFAAGGAGGVEQTDPDDVGEFVFGDAADCGRLVKAHRADRQGALA